MPRTKQRPGVGNRLVRLADLPLDTRIKALQHVLPEAKTEQEAQRLLRLAIDPQDASGRIAA